MLVSQGQSTHWFLNFPIGTLAGIVVPQTVFAAEQEEGERLASVIFSTSGRPGVKLQDLLERMCPELDNAEDIPDLTTLGSMRIIVRINVRIFLLRLRLTSPYYLLHSGHHTCHGGGQSKSEIIN